MSMISNIEEVSANYLVIKDQQKSEDTLKEQETSAIDAGDQNTDSSMFSENVGSSIASEKTTLSKDLDYSIDHLIAVGKINTMHSSEIQFQEKHVNQTTVATIYNQTQNATDRETNLVTPTSYMEPIPRHLNELGVPGDIDN